MAKTPAKRKRGRPSKYTPELAAEICERMAEGEFLNTICEEEGMPTSRTVRRWQFRDTPYRDDFCQSYARARQAQAAALAEEVMPIVDDGLVDMVDIQRARLRMDARKWLASKILPRLYGDKVDVTSGGEKVTTFTLNLFDKSEEKEE